MKAPKIISIAVPEVTEFSAEVIPGGTVFLAFDKDAETTVSFLFSNMEILCKLNSLIDKFIQAVDVKIEEENNERL